jgi:hypothetical protein
VFTCHPGDDGKFKTGGSQSRKTWAKSKILFSKLTWWISARSMVQGVDHLPHKHKAMTSYTSTTKKNKIKILDQSRYSIIVATKDFLYSLNFRSHSLSVHSSLPIYSFLLKFNQNISCFQDALPLKYGMHNSDESQMRRYRCRKMFYFLSTDQHYSLVKWMLRLMPSRNVGWSTPHCYLLTFYFQKMFKIKSSSEMPKTKGPCPNHRLL